MHIYVLRHGAAEPVRPGVSDSERALTSEGRQMVRDLTRGAARLMETVRLLSSPYRRAIETAAIAAEQLDVEGEILETKWLTPHTNPQEAWNEIREHSDASALLLVGHEPLVSTLTAFLLGSGSVDIEFAPATLACVEMIQFRSSPRGVLKWLTPARLLSS